MYNLVDEIIRNERLPFPYVNLKALSNIRNAIDQKLNIIYGLNNIKEMNALYNDKEG
jgi:hypothetical protein